MSTVGLVIIFNHRFDKNLHVLRQIYGKRFKNIQFLIPFYDGNDKDVIPVYESSYQFQGYLIQAYEKIIKMQCEYYVFVGDDLLLNDALNEGNIINELNMNNKSVFITWMGKLNKENGFNWIHARYSSKAFLSKQTTWQGNIDSYENALVKFEHFFGTKYEEYYGKDFFGNAEQDTIIQFIKQNGGTYKIPYPMAASYADMFIIRDNVFFNIARTCGVLSAMNLFVEIAFPTAIVLEVERKYVGLLDETRFKSNLAWDEERNNMEKKYNRSLEKLQNEWDESWLYVHPVKLSVWH